MQLHAYVRVSVPVPLFISSRVLGGARGRRLSLITVVLVAFHVRLLLPLSPLESVMPLDCAAEMYVAMSRTKTVWLVMELHWRIAVLFCGFPGTVGPSQAPDRNGFL